MRAQQPVYLAFHPSYEACQPNCPRSAHGGAEPVRRYRRVRDRSALVSIDMANGSLAVRVSPYSATACST